MQSQCVSVLVKEKFGKTSKVSKYYEQDCLNNFILLFMPLLTASDFIHNHFEVEIYFTFIEKSYIKLQRLSIPNLYLSEKIRNVVIK